jgi:paired amphipathic helix protein Sin3a
MPRKSTKSNVPLKRKRTRANAGNDSDTDMPSPKKQKAIHQKQPDNTAVIPSLVPPPIPHPLAPTSSLGPNADELQWFERAKKHISNKTALTEFHKLLNLYTQDIISAPYAKYRAKSFFGNQTELLVWLNNFLGDEDDEPEIENVIRPTHARISLANCRGLGPSYRLLPKQVCINQ